MYQIRNNLLLVLLTIVVSSSSIIGRTNATRYNNDAGTTTATFTTATAVTGTAGDSIDTNNDVHEINFTTTTTTTATTSAHTDTNSSSSQTYYFDLPSFLLSLNVEKKDDSLIAFQDELKYRIKFHLENFYENKFLINAVGLPIYVEADLESKLLWREVSTEPAKEYKMTTLQTTAVAAKTTIAKITTHNFTDLVFLKTYEVKGTYSCKMKIEMEPIIKADGGIPKPVFLTQSLMDILFLEAFQPQQQWDLLYGFMEASVLEDIRNVNITVLEDGFIQNDHINGIMKEHYSSATHDKFLDRAFDNNNKKNNDNNNNSQSQSNSRTLSPIVIVGVAFSTLFFIAIVAIWIHLFGMWKNNDSINRRRSSSEKAYGSSGGGGSSSSMTVDGTNSSHNNDSLDGTDLDSPTSSYSSSSDSIDDDDDDDDDEESLSLRSQSHSHSRSMISKQHYLDNWAHSMTSIPLRDTAIDKKKKRKKRGQKIVQQAYFRPSHEHSSSLGCIIEADSESCYSGASSSVRTSGSNRSKNRHMTNTPRGSSSSSSSRASSPLTVSSEEEELSSFSLLSSSPLSSSNMVNSNDNHSAGSSSIPLLLPNLYDTVSSIPLDPPGIMRNNVVEDESFTEETIRTMTSFDEEMMGDDDDGRQHQYGHI